MTRNTRTKRGAAIGVERLDERISLSGFSTVARFSTSYTPTVRPAFRLPATPMPPTAPNTFINITPLHYFGLS